MLFRSPGPAFLYVVADGVPSTGWKVMIGDGQGPPVDEDSLKKYVVSYFKSN